MDSTARSASTHESVTVRRLRRIMAGSTALLVGATWPLWKPGGEFPRIPWFSWAVGWPPQLDWVFLVALGTLLVWQFLPRSSGFRWGTRCQCVLLCGALMLLPTDQHRLQPWVWQMTVMAIVIGLSSYELWTIRCLRGITVSIYFWSAVSKLDWAFLFGRGQWLLEGLASAARLSPDLWSENSRLVLAAMFPVGELFVAAALLWPRLRRGGLSAAILMHALLLLALGPFGHQQLPGVLIWNGYFIFQNILLFGRRASLDGAESEGRGIRQTEIRTQIACAFTAVVVLLPALSPWGYWDHWPSWAVYAERPAVVQMAVKEADVPRLPPSLQPFVGPPEPLSDWRPVNLDAWSFDVCRCPMYPQKRYRLAVIAALAVDLRTPPRIIIHGPPDRWTGKREVQSLPSLR